MRLYELVLIFKSSLSSEKRKKLLETVKKWLGPASPQGGDLKITKEDNWGEKALAYPIKKEKSGFYYFASFQGEKGIPLDFEKRLYGQEDILRHLLIRKK